MARKARLYVPISCGFFDDDAIIDAGERAGWLYLAILTKCKQLDSDGLISRPQIERLAVPGWQNRLAKLVEVGLVVQQHDGKYGVPSWSKWNETSSERAKRLAEDRERKRVGKRSDSGRNPDGVRSDSALKEVKEGRKEGKVFLTHPESPHEGTPRDRVGGVA